MDIPREKEDITNTKCMIILFIFHLAFSQWHLGSTLISFILPLSWASFPLHLFPLRFSWTLSFHLNFDLFLLLLPLITIMYYKTVISPLKTWLKQSFLFFSPGAATVKPKSSRRGHVWWADQRGAWYGDEGKLLAGSTGSTGREGDAVGQYNWRGWVPPEQKKNTFVILYSNFIFKI